MPDPSRTAGQLATEIVAWVELSLSQMETNHAPGLRLPGIFAGHPVDASAEADLIYTLGLLAESGITQIGEVDCASRCRELIAALDADQVEGFASYRVSESAVRLIASDPGSWTDAEIAHAISAGRSDAVVDKARNGELPTNWIAVAARCLTGVRALGGEAPLADEVNSMLREVFTRAVAGRRGRGWLDDSAGSGESFAAYDIYTPDTYLFAQPLADSLGGAWSDGLRSVLDDLDDIVQPGGTVVWGRSVGALALAITIELAGVAASMGLATAPDRWLARAEESFAELREWFSSGVISAHQGRQTMFYRGPARRLQMTLDIYGKLLLAATELNEVPEVAYLNTQDTWAPANRLIEFEEARPAALWSRRSRELTFALPLLASWSSDYAPSPRSPGLFEMPTSGHPVMLPVVSVGGAALLPAGLPTSVEHTQDRLLTEHRGWAPAGADEQNEMWQGGGRRAVYEVTGRTLRVEEDLTFDEVKPGTPLSISIPARADRPLDITVDHPGARHQQIDTSGIAEWRSFWAELPTVHQIEVPLEATVNFSWSVTPQLRVASTIFGHQYDRSLYDPIRHRLVEVAAPAIDHDLTRQLRSADILHVAWPEWWSGVDPEWTETLLSSVTASGVKIVWTQHNLLPHLFKTDDAAASYQLWAQAADAIIHHTEWGRDQALATYDYRPGTIHAVIPHGHWGAEYPDSSGGDRTSIEEELGWPAADIRLAVIGSPREEKLLQLVLDGFTGIDRQDMHLLIRTSGDEVVPDDERITVEQGPTPEHLYHRRMHAVDAVILPFAPSGMMTTGTAFDAIGSGTAAITSEWAFFDETFEGADIRYGSTAADLAACLQGLTNEDLDRSAAAMADLQPRFEWDSIAQQTLELFESLYAN